MKKIGFYFLLIFLILTACESLNNRLNLTIENSYQLKQAFILDTLNQPSWIPFQRDTAGSHYLAPSLDSFRDRITAIKLVELWLSLEGLNRELELQAVSLVVRTNHLSCQWDFAELFWYKNYLLALENTDGQWELLEAMLNSHEELTFSISGKVEKVPVNFTLALNLKTEISAEN